MGEEDPYDLTKSVMLCCDKVGEDVSVLFLFSSHANPTSLAIFPHSQLPARKKKRGREKKGKETKEGGNKEIRIDRLFSITKYRTTRRDTQQLTYRGCSSGEQVPTYMSHHSSRVPVLYISCAKPLMMCVRFLPSLSNGPQFAILSLSLHLMTVCFTFPGLTQAHRGRRSSSTPPSQHPVRHLVGKS